MRIVIKKKTLNDDLAAIKNYYPNIEDNLFMQLIALDPTYKENSNSAGTYGKWILNLYNKGQLKKEDFYKVTDYLTEFEQKKKYFSNKDIGQFKDLPSFAKALEEIEVPELTQRQLEKQASKIEKAADLNADIVFEDNNWVVYIPKDYLSSCKLSHNTRWCTGESSHGNDHNYNFYTSRGPLYIIHNKHNPDDKYQFHVETNSFMDRYDTGVNELFEIFDQNLLEFIKKIMPERYNRALKIKNYYESDNAKKNKEKFNKINNYVNQLYPNGYVPQFEKISSCTLVGGKYSSKTELFLIKPKTRKDAYYIENDFSINNILSKVAKRVLLKDIGYVIMCDDPEELIQSIENYLKETSTIYFIVLSPDKYPDKIKTLNSDNEKNEMISFFEEYESIKNELNTILKLSSQDNNYKVLDKVDQYKLVQFKNYLTEIVLIAKSTESYVLPEHTIANILKLYNLDITTNNLEEDTFSYSKWHENKVKLKNDLSQSSSNYCLIDNSFSILSESSDLNEIKKQIDDIKDLLNGFNDLFPKNYNVKFNIVKESPNYKLIEPDTLYDEEYINLSKKPDIFLDENVSIKYKNIEPFQNKFNNVNINNINKLKNTYEKSKHSPSKYYYVLDTSNNIVEEINKNIFNQKGTTAENTGAAQLKRFKEKYPELMPELIKKEGNKLIINEGIERLGPATLNGYKAGIEEIYIPSTVKSIHGAAFNNMPGLKKIIISNDNPNKETLIERIKYLLSGEVGTPKNVNRNLVIDAKFRLNDVIKKEADGYVIYSEKGKKLSKAYKTKEEAEKRLKQIEYFKHKGKDSMIKDYKVEVLYKDNGKLHDIIDIKYDGEYDSEKILEEFYKENPQYKDDMYTVQITDSIQDTKLYIYQFPKDLTKADMRYLDKYNLEYIGHVSKEGDQPEDVLVKGTLKDLTDYAEECLAYDLNDDYLYEVDEFDTELIDDTFVKDSNYLNYNIVKTDNGWYQVNLDGDIREYPTIKEARYAIDEYVYPDIHKEPFKEEEKAEYVVYAEDVYKGVDATNLYYKHKGKAEYSKEQDADLFTKSRAEEIENFKGEHIWKKKKIGDSKIKDSGKFYEGTDVYDTLNKYLNWEGIQGYTQEIIDVWNDKEAVIDGELKQFDTSEDALHAYLEWEGIIGYDWDIMDILEGGVAYLEGYDENEDIGLEDSSTVKDSNKAKDRLKVGQIVHLDPNYNDILNDELYEDDYEVVGFQNNNKEIKIDNVPEDLMDFSGIFIKNKRLGVKSCVCRFQLKDSNTVKTIDELIADEEETIKKYEEAMKTADEKHKALYSHIITEELEHIEELKNIKEMKDSKAVKENMVKGKSYDSSDVMDVLNKCKETLAKSSAKDYFNIYHKKDGQQDKIILKGSLDYEDTDTEDRLIAKLTKVIEEFYENSEFEYSEKFAGGTWILKE